MGKRTARLVELWMILSDERRLRWFRSPMVSSPAVLYSGYREEPRSRSGRSLGTAKHRSTPLRGTLATINYLCCECCAATNPRHRSCTHVLHREASKGGPNRHGAEYRHYTASRGPGEPGQSYREPQSIRPE